MSARADDGLASRRSDERYGRQRGVAPWVIQARIAIAAVGSIAAPIVYRPTAALVVLFVLSYAARMFATEAIYHRYFSHRSYRAGRVAQFMLALLGTQNGQRGPLWWASIHRVHHRHADSPLDPHSPARGSFGHAFIAWLWDRRNADTNLDAIPDFARYRELRWLNRNYALPFYAGGALLAAAGHFGWLGDGITAGSALLWGFFCPVTAVLAGVALVNSSAHFPRWRGGFRRYDTPDQSVNRPLLALLTLGGGWHNNHHRYAAPARAGFAWWEIDPCYYVLRLCEWLRIIRNVKGEIPKDILREGGISS